MSALTPLARWRGFSLIELMVAITLGLLLLAGLFYIYMNASQSSRFQGALALMQNNARYAFEIMGVDIRQAGFTSTRKDDTPTYVVNTSTVSNLMNLFGTPLIGYENTNPPNVCTTTNTTPCYLANTDSLTVVRIDNENKYAISGHTPPTFTLSSWPTSTPPQAGEIFVAADYTHAAVFQVGAANDPTVSYATGTASPDNSGTDLGTFYGGISALKLYRLSGASYYIGRNPAGEPALYRDKLGHNDVTANSTREELVQGIEDMQIEYGVDTDLTPDGSVDDYVDANSAVGTGWGRVLSVRITLTLVSGQNEKVGTTGDRLLRKTFTNTIAVRNRLP